MATAAFTCFPRLPAELRLMIWEEAFSAAARIALAISLAPPLAPELALVTNGDPGLVLDWIGPAPCLVGLSCNEARRVMAKSYVQLPANAAAVAAAAAAATAADAPISASGVRHPPHWLDPDKTIVHIGAWPQAGTVLARLGADVASRLQHVALVFHPLRLSDFYQVCRELRKHCSGLRTLVVEWTAAHADGEQPRFDPRYPLIPLHTGRELGVGLLDHTLLRIILCTSTQFLDGPAFHMLSGSGWRREMDSLSLPEGSA